MKKINPRNAVEIATANPNPAEVPEARFIKGKNLTFYINPESLQVGQQNLSKIERTQNGYAKIGFGEGLISLNFAGKMPIFFEGFGDVKNTYDAAQFETENFSALQESPGWVWFSEFSDFVRRNAKYPFYIGFYGIVAQISSGNVYPVLKGDLTPPAYSQNADNPFLLNYNFTFSGVLVDERINTLKSMNRSTSTTREQEKIMRMLGKSDFAIDEFLA